MDTVAEPFVTASTVADSIGEFTGRSQISIDFHPVPRSDGLKLDNLDGVSTARGGIHQS